jgi:hypothetical protein
MIHPPMSSVLTTRNTKLIKTMFPTLHAQLTALPHLPRLFKKTSVLKKD